MTEEEALEMLEQFTYTKDEIMKGQASAVKFWISETAVKDVIKKLCKNR